MKRSPLPPRKTPLPRSTAPIAREALMPDAPVFTQVDMDAVRAVVMSDAPERRKLVARLHRADIVRKRAQKVWDRARARWGRADHALDAYDRFELVLSVVRRAMAASRDPSHNPR